jgi:UDP-N-acetyl-alpha-D-muramoyl-L-alanyl-L-glutamate epimerase
VSSLGSTTLHPTKADPKSTAQFRFMRNEFDTATGVASLVYAFDDGAELIEKITFPDAPRALPTDREAAFRRALDTLHLIAGISYYKAAVPPAIRIESNAIDAATAALLDELYLYGLGEFAHQNGLDLRGRIAFPAAAKAAVSAPAIDLPRRTLVPIGGGKDSLVSVELLRQCAEPMTAVWVGNSALIQATAERTGLPMLNLKREISPLLFEMNRNGAYNGHIPVTAINSAILACAALLYGFDAIAFSNERSASSANLVRDGFAINHQWSKGLRFEELFRAHLQTRIAANLDYFSALRSFSELAVTSRFAKLDRYHTVFSSCNRNFKILGDRPASRWCGECPKCHFVFLALAPFLPKARLLSIFGRNLLDDVRLTQAFDALLEVDAHKPFECVGEGRESRAAMAALAARAEWSEDALVARFARQIRPNLNAGDLDLAAELQPEGPHHLPTRLLPILHAPG